MWCSSRMITTRLMRALEVNSEYFGISRLQLMENAGHAVASEIASRFKPENTKIAVFCGLGGNGGDGFVSARFLLDMGFDVAVYLLGRGDRIVHAEAKRNWLALQPLKHKMKIVEVPEASSIPEIGEDVVIDALIGVGFRGELRTPIRQMAKKLNNSNAFCVAVDIPTGINADTGEASQDAVIADLTVTFHKLKPGLVKAESYVGEVVVRRIGIPSYLERLAGPGDVQLVVKRRIATAHKGEFGRLLVIGGSEVYYGAPALVALAAYRTGVDLVYIAAPKEAAQAISTMSPNMITLKLTGKHLNLEDVQLISSYMEKVDATVIGPGLGLHGDTVKAVNALLELADKQGIPLLLDADGLKIYAKSKSKIEVPIVFTPHAGEYEVLTGKRPPESLVKKVEEVQEAAERLKGVILLKGHVDVISDGKRVKLNFTGNPGMTVGGTGDTLSGIVGGFMAQGTDPFEAAVAGAFINGAAGDFVFDEKGYHMLPTDIIEFIPHVIENPMSHLKVRRAAF